MPIQTIVIIEINAKKTFETVFISLPHINNMALFLCLFPRIPKPAIILCGTLAMMWPANRQKISNVMRPALPERANVVDFRGEPITAWMLTPWVKRQKHGADFLPSAIVPALR